MENHNHEPKNDHEGYFYKGLFFGLLIGVGLVWFLNSEGGKELVKTTRKKIDAALAGEPGMEEYDYEIEESDVADQRSKTKPTSDPRRFFQKKAK